MQSHLLQGLANGCNLFVDFSVLNFATAKYPCDTMLAFCVPAGTFSPCRYREAGRVLQELIRCRGEGFSV
jgi:hypothetical protein